MDRMHNAEFVTRIVDDGDEGRPGTPRHQLELKVVSVGRIVEVYVEEHGVKTTLPGKGAIGFFELYNGKVRFVCWDDITKEEPKIIVFDKAQEKFRKDE